MIDGGKRVGKWDAFRAWCLNHRRLVGKVLVLIALGGIVFYGICVFLSYKAADIFNIVVAERQLFPGSVTVERLNATPMGEVSFEGLVWKDDKGDTLADIPEGSFKVRLWDVVAQRIGTTTLTDLTVEKGYVHLVLNDKMELQNIKGLKSDSSDQDKKKDGKKNKRFQITGIHGNRKFICKIHFLDGKIEAESPDRHFVIDHVNLESDINTGSLTKIDLTAGHFSGTIEAEYLGLGGTIDFAKDIPSYNLQLTIKECNPKSLGVGVDIDDKASVRASISGDLPSPVIEGTLEMDKLDITALNFTKVRGKFHYEDGTLEASKVTAAVYGGTMEASGNFNLDKKTYHADIKGEKLKGSIAAHDLFLRCAVDLELHMGEDRLNGTKEIYGRFYSGPGRYHILPFNKISGSFEQEGKTLNFKDVVISMAMSDVTTDAFSIVNGKVHLGPIYVEENGARTPLLR